MKNHTSVLMTFVITTLIHNAFVQACCPSGIKKAVSMPCVEECAQVTGDNEKRVCEESHLWTRCCNPVVVEKEDCVVIRMPMPCSAKTECIEAVCMEQEGCQTVRVRVSCPECSVDMVIDERSVCITACPESRGAPMPTTMTQKLPCAVCVNKEKVKIEHNMIDNTLDVMVEKKPCVITRIQVSCCTK